MDNASIHSGEDTMHEFDDVLQSCGIEYIYLPTYSPELNPCELIFASVKRKLREYRNREIPLTFDISFQFSLTKHDEIQRYYNKCIHS